MEWLWPLFHSRDDPAPMLGLTPWRGGVDGATRRGVVALQDGEMVAPPNGAEDGGSSACGSRGAHRDEERP